MNSFTKWMNGAFGALVLILMVILIIITSPSPNEKMMPLTTIIKWVIVICSVAVAAINAFAKYKSNPADALSETRIMAMTILGIAGTAFCLMIGFLSANSNVWHHWTLWTCILTAIAGVIIWIVNRNMKKN